MLNNIDDRKKAYKFIKSFYSGMLNYNKETSKIIVDFGVTTQQVKNLLNNKTEHLIGANAKNLKILFTKILNQSLYSFNFPAIIEYKISVKDFLDLSAKMNIDDILVKNVREKYSC
jgi:hypothetical protein